MKIEEFHKLLNREDLVPDKCYRRDVGNYSLVSYVNNIIGCYISGNLKPIEIFVERARLHIEDNGHDTEAREYYNLVLGYLREIEKYLEEDNT